MEEGFTEPKKISFERDDLGKQAGRHFLFVTLSIIIDIIIINYTVDKLTFLTTLHRSLVALDSFE